MKKFTSVFVTDDIYREVRHYQIDQAGKGRRLRIGEVISELLEKGLTVKDSTVPETAGPEPQKSEPA